MQLRASHWEQPLLAKAAAALGERLSTSRHPGGPTPAIAAAYGHCAEVTRRNSRTFHLATTVVPRAERMALRSLYAFCRVSDDIVDGSDDEPLARLARWREAVAAAPSGSSDPVLVAWADTRARYGIPDVYIAQLLDTLAQDLTTTRYASFDQLATYCYGVASTVGLMAMHIIGYAGPAAVPYAVKLGVALQLTNILRDVGEDWQRGRLYLPLDELAAFGLSEADIAAGRLNGRWRAFMRYQVSWNRRLYREAIPGIGLLHRRGRFAVAAAAELYRAILDDIEASGYDVFRRRAHVGDLAKLRRLPGIWWRATRGYAP
jgi:phytoene synthase